MRELLFACLFFFISSCSATLYSHEISSSEGSYFNAVSSNSLIRGYSYYYLDGATLIEIESIPSDTTTSNVYLQNDLTGRFELKFESELDSETVNGYYLGVSCTELPCSGWTQINTNTITNSGINVYYFVDSFVLDKTVENCGDGLCEEIIDENCATCPDDCACSQEYNCVGGECIYTPSFSCGDYVCNSEYGENCGNCATDCLCDGCCSWGVCYNQIICGDGVCLSGCENSITCPDDCAEQDYGKDVFCGNSECDLNETCDTCSLDCGECPVSETMIYNNGFNHTCKNFELKNKSNVYVETVFRQIFDYKKRFFMISLDCPEILNQNFVSNTCGKCETGVYCKTGFGKSGKYNFSFSELGKGNHTICVWSSASEKYYWNPKISLTTADLSICGNGLCEQGFNESCKTCLEDCGVCDRKAYTTVLFKTAKKKAFVNTSSVINFNASNIIHAIINVTAFNGDSFFGKSVVAVINGKRIVLEPLIPPGGHVSKLIIINSSLFKEGNNIVKIYLTNLKKHSDNSWTENSLMIYYSEEKPEIIPYESNNFNETDSVEIGLWDSKKSDYSYYNVAILEIPENSSVKSAKLFCDLKNNDENFAATAWLVVNGDRVELKNWISPLENEFAEYDYASMLTEGSNWVSVIIDGDSSPESSARTVIHYYGNKPEVKDVIEINPNDIELLDDNYLIEKDGIFLNNYIKSKTSWRLSSIANKLSALETSLLSLENKTRFLSEKYSKIGNLKGEKWSDISNNLITILKEINITKEFAINIKESSIDYKNVARVKESLVRILDHFNSLIDKAFEVNLK